MRPDDVLGVGPEASRDELRAAFRRFAAAHHPDRGGNPETFQAGVDAYRRLAGRPPARRSDVVFHRRPRGLRLLSGRIHRRSTARRHLL